MTNMVCGDCDDDCPWFVMTNPKPVLILTASLTERLTVESKTEKCVAPGGLVTPADLEISSWLFSPPQPPRPLRPLRPPAWRPPSRSWCLATCWPDCWRTAGRWVRGDLTRTRILPPALSTPSYHHHWGNCWRELSRASTWSTSGAARLRWGSCCLMTRRGDIPALCYSRAGNTWGRWDHGWLRQRRSQPSSHLREIQRDPPSYQVSQIHGPW